jgi:hypothetical protein
MTRIARVLVLLVVAACAGQAKQETEAKPAQAPAQPTTGRASRPMPMSMSMCPAMVPGVSISAEDAPMGATVTFTAPPAQVEDLRARVRRMAEMHEHMAGMRERQPVGGREHRGPMGGTMMTPLPPADVSVEEIEGGSRIVLAARDPADVEALRAGVRRHVERMRDGGCPMRQRQDAPPSAGSPVTGPE